MANNDIIVSEMTPASQINTGDLMIMTQPDAQSETGYSTKSGTVLQVSNKMLKGTTYETDLPSFTNKNVLGGMEELKGDIFNLLPVDEASGSIANFETELAAPLQSVLVNVLATGGNGTPDNPNPINGYSSANITRCGVNLWDEEIEEGYIDSSGNELPSNISARSKNFCACVPNVEYRVYKGYEGGNPPQLCWYDINKNFISRETGAVLTSTAPSNAYFFKLSMYGMLTSVNHNVGVNYPSTDTTYHAYNGQTYTIAFGQTVYGGVLDVTRGKLHVTHGFKVFTGDASESWDKHGGIASWFFIDNAISDGFMDGTKADFQICNVGVQVKYDNVTSLTDGQFAYGSSNKRFVFKNTDYVDVADFKTWLANNNMQVCYELATPFDIDLPPEVISAVVGVNNVFADCGGDTSVKFKDTIQHYIDKKIAQTQALIL